MTSKNSLHSFDPEIPTKLCKSRSSNVCVHFQNTREATQAIKYMHIREATKYQKDVILKKLCVPFHCYSGGVVGVHRPNSRAGRRVSGPK